MLRIFTFIITLLACISAFCQEPKWIGHTPQPRNGDYFFITETVNAKNINDGKIECLNNLLSDMAVMHSRSVTTNLKINTNSFQVYEDGKLRETLTYNSSANANFGEQQLPIKVNTLDTYYDKKRKECSVLYMVGKSPDAVFDNVSVTGNYGLKGVWRSAVLPGWGQFYKGHTAKGVVVSVGFCAGAVSAIVAETSRRQVIHFANNTHDKSQILNYGSTEARMATIRNISIGICAAFYLYGLIDAGVSKGAKRVVFNGNSVAVRF